MNHLINKFKIAGAGKKKPKPQPATLTPPELGVHQLASSYAYAEIIDLISDGPIDGLVNQNNSKLNGLGVLQGIYMNDTPIAVTNDETANENPESVFNFYEIANTITNIVSNLGTLVRQSTVASNYFVSLDDSFRLSNNIKTLNYDDPTDAPIEYLSIDGWERVVTDDGIQYTPIGFNDKIALFTPKEILGTRDEFQITSIRDEVVNFSAKNKSFTNDTYRQIDHYKDYLIANNMYRNNYGTPFFKDFINTIYSNFSSSKISTDGDKSTYEGASALIIDASVINFDPSLNPLAFFDENDKIITELILGFVPSARSNVKILNYAWPDLGTEKTTPQSWNGKMIGWFIVVLPLTYIRNNITEEDANGVNITKMYSNIFFQAATIDYLASVRHFVVGRKFKVDSQKYNYTNILAEVKTGEETQKPFKYFNNVYIDRTYGIRLFGPFRTQGQIQTLVRDQSVLTTNFKINNPSGTKKGLPIDEGSNDIRGQGNFSGWDKNLISYDEEAISFTHTIENPNVDSVIVSINIDSLRDTASIDIAQGGGNPKKINAGSAFPGVLNIEIEVGKINEKGVTIGQYSKRYQIVALIESPTTIDIGNQDSEQYESTAYKFIKDLDRDTFETGLFDPIKLPSAFDVSGPEETPTRRYVKVSKLSTETNSTLVSKSVSLEKVTEIIPVNCSYPFSSMIGTKLDARTFQNIPTRTFDARLKKVKIPSNYYPVKDNILETDKRYYTSVVDYENATTEDKYVYKGDWNGTFKIGWTDNPAWVLYDLLTSNRYGLGQYIDQEDINKWDLYKIARFCDSVDEEGYFVGVPDGRGGLEPRYSCNIIFQEGTKVFDSINQIANLFRGSVFYNNNEINFLDDRLRDPTALFSNSNVKDGIFSYTNYKRDEKFNAIEVIYIDKFDNFKTKVEYVEDEEDILQRGMFKKQVNSYGVTSKAMANRIARHLIYQTIKENQSVSFIGGNEVLLCKPGDLIIVEDELKSLKSNFGRVLNVDASAKTVRINETFITGEYTSGITLYSPTGQTTSEDIDVIANLNRERLTGFVMNANAGGVLDDFTGIYKFSGYSDGFNFKDDLYAEQYAVYTGDRTPQNIIYYSTLATGWVYATGQAFTNNNDYDKWIATSDIKSISELNIQNIQFHYPYDSTSPNYRGSPANNTFFNVFDNSNGELTKTIIGAQESEIAFVTTPQIITLSITGAVNQDYGSLLYVDSGDINANLLRFVSEGSAYRIQRKNSDDQIYKILEIREEAPNEYAVVATKYDSGKFDLIENSVSVEFQSDTFGYGVNDQINDINYVTLDTPVIDSITTGNGSIQGYYISGDWQPVSNATGYNVVLRNPSSIDIQSINTSETGFSFDNNTEIGNYTFTLNALGDNSKNAGTRYYDSKYVVSGISILPINSDLYQLTTAVVNNITTQ